MKKIIDFVSGGQVGDLIHQMLVVKSICITQNAKANLYLVDDSYNIPTCGNFTFDLNKTYQDIKYLIIEQDYINSFDILPRNFDGQFVNLNMWRTSKFKNWTDLLSDFYNLNNIINKWINVEKNDVRVKDKVLIHNSTKRLNNNFDWNHILETINEDVFFITTNRTEFESFRYKNNHNVKMHLVSDIYEMAISINSCRLFIGNQSSPFAIASALDVPRIVELYDNSSEFYNGEERYSENISWFLNCSVKFN